MSSCIVYGVIELGTNFDRGKYPVLDPRRTAGPGPFRYGYNLAADGIVVGIARDSSLSACEMRVDLVSTLAEPKDILAWNFCTNDLVDRVGSPGLGLPAAMTIRKPMSTGLSSGQGADTVILRRRDAAFSNWTPWYWFPVQDFWDFWGGCNVTFDWQNDYVRPRGLWGDETPAPSYPLVALPDGTLMVDNQGNFSVVFGGTDFAVPPNLLRVWMPRLAPTALIPARPLPSTPADFTLVREVFAREVYVIFGGARFEVPDTQALTGLGFSSSQVRIVPPGATAKLRPMPIDGTLLREQNDPRVYFVENQELRWVTSPAAMNGRCLPWRHVRIVADNQLVGLSKGPDLGPP
jgi:hypothetical protein